MKLSIIIPAHNEEKTLEQVVLGVEQAFKGEDYEIILVNDGSTDETYNIISRIKDPHIRTVHHEKNYGKGRSIRSALEKTRGDYVAIQDADLEYDPKNLYELWKIVKNKKVVIYGKRSGKDGYILNRIGNKVLSLTCNILFSSDISDIYTCYKIIPRELMNSLNLESNGFEIEAEIIAKILKKKIDIEEISIQYMPRSFEEGKHINWKDGYKGIVKLMKVRFF